MYVIYPPLHILILRIGPYQTIVNDWLQKGDQTWTRGIGSFYDPFDPSLICDALADTTHGFRSVVFGWDTTGKGAPCDDVISKLFIEASSEFDLYVICE
jgi:hypothetical protein